MNISDRYNKDIIFRRRYWDTIYNISMEEFLQMDDWWYFYTAKLSDDTPFAIDADAMLCILLETLTLPVYLRNMVKIKCLMHNHVNASAILLHFERSHACKRP